MNNKGITRVSRIFSLSLLVLLYSYIGNTAYAHFQMVIPSNEMVSQKDNHNINLDIRFYHPFEGQGMNMEKPVQFGVITGGNKVSLLNDLKEVKLTDREGKKFTAFKTTYSIKHPGDHVFYLEPKPYWEPAEDKFIIHYAKVIVNALGMEEGWDTEAGLKTEIIPLTRPYGLWAGNVFQGIVKLNGKPVPFADVEVEYFNDQAKMKAPADPMTTQVVKADQNGVFTYAMPKSGWWGFAALSTDEKTMTHNGKEYPVEIGAILWVKTYNMK
ncbi:MAG: DUF4198 domain-containing protein [Nitrospira sp.]|nr:DUF4198 domain-containing protein [Nitrospira sp.]